VPASCTVGKGERGGGWGWAVLCLLLGMRACQLHTTQQGRQRQARQLTSTITTCCCGAGAAAFSWLQLATQRARAHIIGQQRLVEDHVAEQEAVGGLRAEQGIDVKVGSPAHEGGGQGGVQSGFRDLCASVAPSSTLMPLQIHSQSTLTWEHSRRRLGASRHKLRLQRGKNASSAHSACCC